MLKVKILNIILNDPPKMVHRSTKTTGEVFNFVEGTKIQNAEVFAGNGTKKLYMKVLLKD